MDRVVVAKKTVFADHGPSSPLPIRYTFTPSEVFLGPTDG